MSSNERRQSAKTCAFDLRRWSRFTVAFDSCIESTLKEEKIKLDLYEPDRAFELQVKLMTMKRKLPIRQFCVCV